MLGGKDAPLDARLDLALPDGLVTPIDHGDGHVRAKSTRGYHRPSTRRRAQPHQHETDPAEHLKQEHTVDAAARAAPYAHGKAARQHAHTGDGHDNAQHIAGGKAEDHGRDQRTDHAPQEIDGGKKGQQAKQAPSRGNIGPAKGHLLPKGAVHARFGPGIGRETHHEQRADCKGERRHVDRDHALQPDRLDQEPGHDRRQDLGARAGELDHTVGPAKVPLRDEQAGRGRIGRPLDGAKGSADRRDEIDVPDLQHAGSGQAQNRRRPERSPGIGGDHDPAPVPAVDERG